MPAVATSILGLQLATHASHQSMHRILALLRQAKMPAADLFELDYKEVARRSGMAAGPLTRAAAAARPHHLRRAEDLLARLRQVGCTVLTTGDPDYPAALRDSLGEAAPPLLTCFGNAGLLDAPASAAIVGTRQASEGGLQVACGLAGMLVAAGAVVVSGGAAGIDAAAHASALERGGGTVAVLPHGLLSCSTPPLMKQALDDGAAVLVSEWPPDLRWQTYAAVTRNATIAGLAGLVCVVEPKKRGGSIRTARAALEQGKPVVHWCGRLPVPPPLDRARDAVALPWEEDAGMALLRDLLARPPRGRAQGELFSSA
jgi:DNA processing protein